MTSQTPAHAGTRNPTFPNAQVAHRVGNPLPPPETTKLFTHCGHCEFRHSRNYAGLGEFASPCRKPQVHP